MHTIPFNQFALTGNEINYIQQALHSEKISGDGQFSLRCQALLEQQLHAKKVLLTSSGTAALEMAAILSDIKPGDEVIMPSYTFVSTANAFVTRGATCVFVDIRPDTQNINEHLIEQAINAKTVAIVPVHYAGISCAMDTILDLATKYNLLVIEDAAHGLYATYKGQALGTIGDIGCFSFHETKNYSCGEGGAIVINNSKFSERAEIIREKGTDRSKFFRGEVDKYTWQDLGSSYLMSDLQAAFLLANLEKAETINTQRCAIWNYYYQQLQDLQAHGHLQLPCVAKDCEHNGHLFYIKIPSTSLREQLIEFLKDKKIQTVFHYLPLHDTPMGRKHGRFVGDDYVTLKTSEQLLRLPLFYSLSIESAHYVTEAIHAFFGD